MVGITIRHISLIGRIHVGGICIVRLGKRGIDFILILTDNLLLMLAVTISIHLALDMSDDMVLLVALEAMGHLIIVIELQLSDDHLGWRLRERVHGVVSITYLRLGLYRRCLVVDQPPLDEGEGANGGRSHHVRWEIERLGRGVAHHKYRGCRGRRGRELD